MLGTKSHEGPSLGHFRPKKVENFKFKISDLVIWKFEYTNKELGPRARTPASFLSRAKKSRYFKWTKCIIYFPISSISKFNLKKRHKTCRYIWWMHYFSRLDVLKVEGGGWWWWWETTNYSYDNSDHSLSRSANND